MYRVFLVRRRLAIHSRNSGVGCNGLCSHTAGRFSRMTATERRGVTMGPSRSSCSNANTDPDTISRITVLGKFSLVKSVLDTWPPASAPSHPTNAIVASAHDDFISAPRLEANQSSGPISLSSLSFASDVVADAPHRRRNSRCVRDDVRDDDGRVIAGADAILFDFLNSSI